MVHDLLRNTWLKHGLEGFETCLLHIWVIVLYGLNVPLLNPGLEQENWKAEDIHGGIPGLEEILPHEESEICEFVDNPICEKVVVMGVNVALIITSCICGSGLHSSHLLIF